MRNIARGFVLWALVIVVAAVIFWDTPPMWEFFLHESLPYFENTNDKRLLSALPWTSGNASLPFNWLSWPSRQRNVPPDTPVQAPGSSFDPYEDEREPDELDDLIVLAK